MPYFLLFFVLFLILIIIPNTGAILRRYACHIRSVYLYNIKICCDNNTLESLQLYLCMWCIKCPCTWLFAIGVSVLFCAINGFILHQFHGLIRFSRGELVYIEFIGSFEYVDLPHAPNFFTQCAHVQFIILSYFDNLSFL